MGQQQPGAGVNSRYISRIFLLSSACDQSTKPNDLFITLNPGPISCVEPRPATQATQVTGSPRVPIVTGSHYDRIMQPPVSTGCPPNINIALVISPDIYFTFSSVRAVLAMNEMIQHGGHILVSRFSYSVNFAIF